MSVFGLILLSITVAYGQIKFKDVTIAAGLTHSSSVQGVTVFDFNNDGLEDIFVSGYGTFTNKLYKNLGNLQFEEVGVAAGISNTGSTRAAAAGDIDNDGDIDLFIGVIYGPSMVFLNNGDETFSDVTTTTGINNSDNLQAAFWSDYDQDGLLDLYIANWNKPNQLCVNNGTFSFSDIAVAMNATGPAADAILGGSFIDFDRDGDEDIFLVQDGNIGSVLLRRESHGSYSNISQSAGVVLPIQGMGVAAGDFNRDGLFDVHISNMHQNTLMRNEGNQTFSDVSAQFGGFDTTGSMGWGTFFFDADNDGWLDIYTNNTTAFGGVLNSFYRNLQGAAFEDIAASSGMQSANDGIGAAYADFDNDGDLDVVLGGQSAAAGAVLLFRNDTPAANNWVQFSLQGTQCNYNAIGSIVEIYSQSGLQASFVAGSNSYASQNSLRQHFGLGVDTQIDSVIVSWTGGSKENFGVLDINQHHVLQEGASTTGISPDGKIFTNFQLKPAYPNPFNPQTTIEYQLSTAAPVKLEIFDLLGRRIKTLVGGNGNSQSLQQSGTHKVVWNGRNDSGAPVSSGVYFLRGEADGSPVLMQKLWLIK